MLARVVPVWRGTHPAGGRRERATSWPHPLGRCHISPRGSLSSLTGSIGSLWKSGLPMASLTPAGYSGDRIGLPTTAPSDGTTVGLGARSRARPGRECRRLRASARRKCRLSAGLSASAFPAEYITEWRRRRMHGAHIRGAVENGIANLRRGEGRTGRLRRGRAPIHVVTCDRPAPRPSCRSHHSDRGTSVRPGSTPVSPPDNSPPQERDGIRFRCT